MKTTRQHLQKLIKEELDAVMKEAEEGLEEGYTDEGRKEAEEAFKSARKNRDADEKKAARVKAKEDKAGASQIRKSGDLDDMKRGKVEEVKGAMGANMADFDSDMRRPTAGAPGTSARQAIHSVAFADDEPDDAWDDDYNVDGDPIDSGTKDELIDGMLEQMGIDSTSQEGMDLRMAIKAAAEKFSERSDDKWSGVDPLAQRKPVQRVTKKGKAFKDDTETLKGKIKRQANKGGLKEEAEELEEVKEMEQISESFRRFTKILKD